MATEDNLLADFDIICVEIFFLGLIGRVLSGFLRRICEFFFRPEANKNNPALFLWNQTGFRGTPAMASTLQSGP